MQALGFNLVPGNHPIIPIILGDAKIAQEFASQLLKEEIYVVAFSYPVVPVGKARIRIQICANHTIEELDRAIRAFSKVGYALGIISSN